MMRQVRKMRERERERERENKSKENKSRENKSKLISAWVPGYVMSYIRIADVACVAKVADFAAKRRIHQHVASLRVRRWRDTRPHSEC